MLRFDSYSGLYKLTSTQWVKAPLDDVWDYFSNPKNLQSLTPDDLDFKILTNPNDVMGEGDIIAYKIQLLPLVKTKWITEIKSVEVLRSFVDEQRTGPYKMWHHRHTFEAKDGGTLMTDEVHFMLPLGFLSRPLYRLFIMPKLKGIFKFRASKVNEIFK